MQSAAVLIVRAVFLRCCHHEWFDAQKVLFCFIYDGLGREDNRLAVESVAFRLHMKAMVMLSSLTA
jgi:hypothetical protein